MDFKKYKKTDEGVELLSKLKRRLKVRGFDVEELSDESLFDEIESAIESVNDRRHFTPTDTKLFEDKYKNIVIRLAICSVAKMGAEGEIIHSENGISRSYSGSSEHPSDILNEIVPLGRIRNI